jgi:hypothetical protein
MPDENNKNNEGDGGDAAAQAAAKATADKAVADKAAADAAGGGAGEETVTIKKSELEKIKSDRDNYQKGLLQKKADERNPGNQGGQGGGEGAGQGADQGGGNVIDEKKISDVATAAVNKTLRDASEKTAKRAFLKDHPEYVDDTQWRELMTHLTFKGGELTYDDVVGRMEAALFEHKRVTGKLEEHLNSVKERARQEGRVEGQFDGTRATGGTGDRQGGSQPGTGLSPKGEEMARAMHTDPEKARKIDPQKDNVINLV